jgi:arylsulfatase A-like enzyme
MPSSPCGRAALFAAALLAALALTLGAGPAAAAPPRNIVLIYADDVGYGDVSAYGARKVRTPHIDRLAREGLRFLDAHSAAATCTPSRYAMLTGEYAFRRKDTGIAAGDARLIIQPGRTTLASILKGAGYTTGVVGKWHLGLGDKDLDWNGEIKPGPLELGFDYAFLIPATGDRVPCVYVEDRRVVGLDPKDPIQVSYTAPIGDEPTGESHPHLLKLHPSHGHDRTIVNGISRIGWMTGGKAARWVDEDMADVITRKATDFIDRHKDGRFFLFFSTQDIHVPRVPHPRFAGKTTMGPRGDVIAQLDHSVSEVLSALDRHGVARDTLVIFSSDNGPVVDDGYKDQAVEKLGGHKPAGRLRGGKYSAFEAGTRVPFIARWPAGLKRRGASPALLGQVDLPATLAALTGQALSDDDAPDSLDLLPALLGKASRARDHLVEQAQVLSLRTPRWKLILPGEGKAVSSTTGVETGIAPRVQLYAASDLGERKDVADRHPKVVAELTASLERIRTEGRSRPRGKQASGARAIAEH